MGNLEILSAIIISRILHTHDAFKVKEKRRKKKKVKSFFEKLKVNVEKYSSKISEDKIDCWSEMKDEFPKHMKNKINSFLPIFQKYVEVADKYLNIDDIKVKHELAEQTLEMSLHPFTHLRRHDTPNVTRPGNFNTLVRKIMSLLIEYKKLI